MNREVLGYGVYLPLPQPRTMSVATATAHSYRDWHFPLLLLRTESGRIRITHSAVQHTTTHPHVRLCGHTEILPHLRRVQGKKYEATTCLIKHISG